MASGDNKPRMLSIRLFQIGHSNMILTVYSLYTRERFISDEASKIRRNRALGTLGLAGLVTAGYNFEPTNFYVHDLHKGWRNKIGLDSKSTTRTEKDMSDNFNNQIQELAALAIASD